MPDLITDEDLVNAVYKWNLLFFEGRMIATNEPSDRKNTIILSSMKQI